VAAHAVVDVGSLIGFKPDGGAAPESYEKVRHEAIPTLETAKKTAGYMESGLSRLLFVACELDARTRLDSGGGYPVRWAKATLHPQLPKDEQQVAVELQERRDARQISQLTMLEALHGPEIAAREMTRIGEDDARAAAVAQRSLGIGMAIGGGA